MANTKTRFASAAAALLMTGAVLAQLPPAPPPPARWTIADLRLAFQRADANSDGLLTRAEAQQLTILPAAFEALDANKDGILNAAEYEAGVVAAVRPA